MPNLLNELSVPVPDILESSIGYFGECRYVGFYWGAGEVVYYNDGFTSGTDTSWEAYQAFMHHEDVRDEVQEYDFGNKGIAAKDWLVLDRETRLVYAVPAYKALVLLSGQTCSTEQHLPPLTDAGGDGTDVSASLAQHQQQQHHHQRPSPDELAKAVNETDV